MPVDPDVAHWLCLLVDWDGKPLLDPKLVRVGCVMRNDTQTCWQRDDNGEFQHKDGTRWTRRGCRNCQGRGWNPSTDPWAYVRAAWTGWWTELGCNFPSSFAINVSDRIWAALCDGDDPGEAAFKAVAEALLEEVANAD